MNHMGVRATDVVKWLSPRKGVLRRGWFFPLVGGRGDDAKRPLWRWRERRANVWEVASAVSSGRGVGVIPDSLGLAVLDIDSGAAHAAPRIEAAHPGVVSAVSWSRRGVHMIFRAPEHSAGNGAVEYLGASGDVRHRDGYVAIPGERYWWALVFAVQEGEMLPELPPMEMASPARRRDPGGQITVGLPDTASELVAALADRGWEPVEDGDGWCGPCPFCGPGEWEGETRLTVRDGANGVVARCWCCMSHDARSGWAALLEFAGFVAVALDESIPMRRMRKR